MTNLWQLRFIELPGSINLLLHSRSAKGKKGPILTVSGIVDLCAHAFLMGKDAEKIC
jgi:hypothetical protein